MTLITRAGKGAALTHNEMDADLVYLDNKVTGSDGYLAVFNGETAVSSSRVKQVGSVVQVTGSLNVMSGITGSLFGTATTASYVQNAVSASYALSSSYSQNASLSTSSSYALTSSLATTASHVDTLISASFTTNTDSIAFEYGTGNVDYYTVNNIESASYALTASYSHNSTSASYALTASYAMNGGGGTSTPAFPYTGSALITGSLGVTGSISTTKDATINGIVIGTGAGNILSNTVIGSYTGIANTTGNQNVFIGEGAGISNLIGGQNTVVGYYAGSSNTSGSGNVLLGSNAGTNNTKGNYNTAIGDGAGAYNGTGSSNVFLGVSAGLRVGSLSNLLAANSSIFIGENSRALNQSENNQIVIGNSATGLGSNTTVLGSSSTTRTHLYGNLSLGTTATPTSYLLLAAPTSTNGSLRLTSGVAYTGTDSGTVWYETTNTRLRFLKGTIASDVLLTYDNYLLKGTGTRMLTVNSVGDISATDIVDQGFVTDTDVIAAITGSSYTLDRATITPANSKIFYQGQMYDSGSYTYLALDDNYVRRW